MLLATKASIFRSVTVDADKNVTPCKQWCYCAKTNGQTYQFSEIHVFGLRADKH